MLFASYLCADGEKNGMVQEDDVLLPKIHMNGNGPSRVSLRWITLCIEAKLHNEGYTHRERAQ